MSEERRNTRALYQIFLALFLLIISGFAAVIDQAYPDIPPAVFWLGGVAVLFMAVSFYNHIKPTVDTL